MNMRARLMRGVSNPMLLARGLNRLYHRRFNRRSHNTDGVDLFSEDWDNLLLLDACRYDMFERISDLPGTLSRQTSRGAATAEFLQANFDGRELLDTVYVTANPQLYRNRHRIDVDFHAVVNVWSEQGWDEQFGTVLPETMADATAAAAERYPNKRILAHFMQPHYPFLTDETAFDKGHLDSPGGDGENVWNQVMIGGLDIDEEEVWNLYDENLRAVLPSVERLFNELDGRTVVTSDHGNMVGERATPIPVREWGHPRGVYTPELVEIPWLVFENRNRKRTVSERPEAIPNDADKEIVTDRLRQLGYAE